MVSRKTFPIVLLFLSATAFLRPAAAFAAAKPAPLKFTMTMRFESQSNVRDPNGKLGAESFNDTLIMANRQMNKKLSCAMFYGYRLSFDSGSAVSHVVGVSGIYLPNPHFIGTVGYTYSSSLKRSALMPAGTADRLSLSGTYIINPKEKTGPKYSLTTSYSSLTNLDDQKTVSEKFGVSIPVVPQKIWWDLGYRYTYNVNIGRHVSNQFSGSLSVKRKHNKFSIGVNNVDNVIALKRKNNTVADVSWTRSKF